ncbi:AAA family ATPase [Streptomyces sp. NPDC020917]|uniref:AAA family ATPase n=1 Tax=Streptomyces sp. NPDC020917 TaxID=3365102 RepID=UPI0037ADFDF4
MTNPIRIGITGAHSTGKTMLLRRIEMELRAEGIRVARTGWVGKRAAGLGLPKREQHTAASTEWAIAQGIADEIGAAQSADVVLADCAVVDALACWHAAVEFRGEILDPGDDERMRLLAATQHAKYDLLLATVLDPAAPVEPKRHAYDSRYRELVDRHVHGLLAEQDIEHLRVTHDPHDEGRAVKTAVRLALQLVPA